MFRFNLGGEKSGEKRYAAIDCFVLTESRFTPNFQYKPGEKPAGVISLEAERSWAFTPQRDRLAAGAGFDLRYLNEKTAGEHGFVRLSPDGNSFVRGDGLPIRFWGGSTYAQKVAREKADPALLLHHAGFLAKRGVNIVRIHDEIEPKQAGSRVTDVDLQVLDDIYRTVAAMKKFGIYTIISPFWPSHAHPQPSWGIADARNGNCTGLLFFDPCPQARLQGLAKAHLCRCEPLHTYCPGQGSRGRDDPNPE